MSEVYGKREDGTFGIDAYRFDDAVAMVAKLSKRAKRTGNGGLGLELVGHERHEVIRGDAYGREIKKKVFVAVVRVTGEVPKVAGHAFVARIEHTPAGNIVSRAPGQESVALPLAYRTAEATCDHCKTARRRKDTFALQNEAGQLVRIGRQCLADYLRTEDVLDAVKLWKLLQEIEVRFGGEDEEGFGGGGGREYTGTPEFMSAVAASVRTLGWRSRSMCRDGIGGQSTADDASFLCGPKPDQGDRRADWEERQPNDGDVAVGQTVLVWARELADRGQLTDYLHNVAVAASLPFVTPRNAGILASAHSAYAKEKEIELARRKRAEKHPTTHVGEVGKRQHFECLTVARVRHSENDWGTTTIVALEDAAGNELTWFASRAHEWEPGMVVSGKATVKAHGQYNGRPQTTLTRCDFEMVHTVAKAS